MAANMPTSPQSQWSRVQTLDQKLTQFQVDQGAFASIVNNDMATLASRIGAIESTIRQREEAIKSAFDATAAQHATDLSAVVAQAKSEFDTQRAKQEAFASEAQVERAKLESIASAVQVEFNKLQQQIDDSSARGSGHEPGAKFTRGFLPIKELKPPKLAKEEQWREWSEHFS